MLPPYTAIHADRPAPSWKVSSHGSERPVDRSTPPRAPNTDARAARTLPTIGFGRRRRDRRDGRAAVSPTRSTSAASMPAFRSATIASRARAMSSKRASSRGGAMVLSSESSEPSLWCRCQSRTHGPAQLHSAPQRARWTGRSSVARIERQRERVDAVALTGRRGTVGEHVPEVTTAAATDDLRTAHAVRVVRAQLDRVRNRGLGEARPSGARLELRARVEELRATGGAPVRAVLVAVPELAAERALGAGAPEHLELLGRQRPTPLVLGLVDVSAHRHSWGLCAQTSTSIDAPIGSHATPTVLRAGRCSPTTSS